MKQTNLYYLALIKGSQLRGYYAGDDVDVGPIEEAVGYQSLNAAVADAKICNYQWPLNEDEKFVPVEK